MDALGGEEAATVNCSVLQYPLILDLSDGVRGTFTPQQGAVLPSMFGPMRPGGLNDPLLLNEALRNDPFFSNLPEPMDDLDRELEALRQREIPKQGAAAGAGGVAGPSNASPQGARPPEPGNAGNTGTSERSGGARPLGGGPRGEGNDGDSGGGGRGRGRGGGRGGAHGGGRGGGRTGGRGGNTGPRTQRGMVQRSVALTLQEVAQPLYTICLVTEERDATADLDEDELADEAVEQRELARDAEARRRAREGFDDQEADAHREALGYDDETPTICSWCLKFIEDPSELQKDHIVARSKGGVTVPENLCLMHANCNKNAKGTQHLMHGPFHRMVIRAGCLFHDYTIRHPELYEQLGEEGSVKRGRPSASQLEYQGDTLALINAFAVFQRLTSRMARQDEAAAMHAKAGQQRPKTGQPDKAANQQRLRPRPGAANTAAEAEAEENVPATSDERMRGANAVEQLRGKQTMAQAARLVQDGQQKLPWSSVGGWSDNNSPHSPAALRKRFGISDDNDGSSSSGDSQPAVPASDAMPGGATGVALRKAFGISDDSDGPSNSDDSQPAAPDSNARAAGGIGAGVATTAATVAATSLHQLPPPAIAAPPPLLAATIGATTATNAGPAVDKGAAAASNTLPKVGTVSSQPAARANTSQPAGGSGSSLPSAHVNNRMPAGAVHVGKSPGSLPPGGSNMPAGAAGAAHVNVGIKRAAGSATSGVNPTQKKRAPIVYQQKPS